MRRVLFPFSAGKPSPPRPMLQGFGDEINRVRVENGQHPLIQDPLVDMHAQEWSTVMAECGKLWHGNHEMRFHRFWPDRLAAENIAMGYPSVEAVVAGWMADRAHRYNLLHDQWSVVGVGLARAEDSTPYWCAQFVE